MTSFFSLYNFCPVLSSNPCKAMDANNGEITPPCGVPAVVAANFPESITPDFNQALICRLTDIKSG